MSLIMFVASLIAAQYLIGARVASELIGLWKVAAACAAMAVLVMMMRHELYGRDLNAVVELVLTAALGVVVYLGTLSALGVRLEGRREAAG